MDRQLVVSIHDVTIPHWNRVARILERLSAIGVAKRSLLVIPNYQGKYPVDQDREFAAWLRELEHGGDEVILHGYEHVGVGSPQGIGQKMKERWYTQGEGEFLSLEYDEARRRIELGKAILSSMSVRATGFVPPSWLINAEGLKAVVDSGFQYTNSYLNVTDLANGASHLSPSLVFGPGNLNEDLGIALQRIASKFLNYSPRVRIVIHPPCIDDTRRFDDILSIIEGHLGDHLPATYFELLAALRKGSVN